MCVRKILTRQIIFKFESVYMKVSNQNSSLSVLIRKAISEIQMTQHYVIFLLTIMTHYDEKANSYLMDIRQSRK